jgi:hypothetical protein
MNLTSLTALKTRISRYLRYGDHIRPQRDWLFIMGMGAILFIVSASWSYWIFHRVSAGESLETQAGGAPTINAATLESVKAIFDTRSAERAHYQNDYRFVDPSR